LLYVIARQPVCGVWFQQAKTSDLSKVYQVLAQSTVKWTMGCPIQPAIFVEVFVSSTVHPLIGRHAQAHDLKLLTNATNI